MTGTPAERKIPRTTPRSSNWRTVAGQTAKGRPRHRTRPSRILRAWISASSSSGGKPPSSAGACWWSVTKCEPLLAANPLWQKLDAVDVVIVDKDYRRDGRTPEKTLECLKGWDTFCRQRHGDVFWLRTGGASCAAF